MPNLWCYKFRREKDRSDGNVRLKIGGTRMRPEPFKGIKWVHSNYRRDHMEFIRDRMLTFIAETIVHMKKRPYLFNKHNHAKWVKAYDIWKADRY